MQNPYFQTKYYEEETVAGRTEKRIEEKVSKILKKIWKRKNV
jgi:hypothetical protein